MMNYRNSKIVKCSPFLCRTQAFSLIEMVVYIAIFATLSIVIINVLLTSVQAFNQLRIDRDVNDSAISVMERLTREIRNAKSVDLAQSNFATSSSKLVLNTTDAVGAAMTVEFSVASSSLHIKENSIDKGSLTSGKTAVDTFRLYLINNTNSSAIKIELFLSGRRGSIEKQEAYYNTTVLRDAY